MTSTLIFLIALASVATAPDPISLAIESYKGVDTYRVTLRSRGNGSSRAIRYYYKKPGFVRMEFISPHEGAVLVYNPSRKEVRIRPFGFLKPLVLALSPDSPIVKSPEGHRVDLSDIGELLKTVKAVQSEGNINILGDEDVGERKTQCVSVKGAGGFTVNGIHRYLLWLDKKSFLPLKAASFDLKGKMIEEVLMDDLEINLEFEDGLFNL